MTANEIHIRLVLLGDSECGKSSILKRLATNEFPNNICKTIGATYICHTLEIQHKLLRLCIWDISGQEKYSHLSKLYSNHCNAIIFVVDASQSNQLESLKKWYQRLIDDDNIDSESSFYICINKIDLTKESNFSDIEDFSSSINAKLFLTSAKTNKNIFELFYSISLQFINYKGSSLRESIFLSSQKHSFLLSQPKKRCC